MPTTSNGQDYETAHGEKYFVKPDHRNGGWRSQWAVSATREVQIFEYSLGQGWGDGSVCWGLNLESEKAAILGTRGEFISKHPRPAANVPWHGYPAQPVPAHPNDVPPDGLLQNWRSASYVSFTTIKKIHRGTWSLK